VCGIVGILGKAPVADRLIAGLKRLEYRGYDSAGIAVLGEGGIERVRAEGKLANLQQAYDNAPLDGLAGIGHTRWATHGVPNEINAHPHMTEQVVVVHNGIIENFHELREELKEKGYHFTSETDTEVIPILMTDFLKAGKSPREAFKAMLGCVEGAFALAALFTEEPDALYTARRGAPLALGYGEGEIFLASDAIAMAPFTKQVSYLRENDWARATRDGVEIFDAHHQPVEREIVTSELDDAVVGKGHYAHYMLKEICEQPAVIGEALSAFYDPLAQTVSLPEFGFNVAEVPRITIIACGTSFYAGQVAKYWLERYAQVPVEVDIASEFRYRDAVFSPGGVVMCISQSGETADTLAAMRHAKEQGQHTIAVVNVPESTMAREADLVLRTFAGPEIGVASTKAFTAQLVTLACFTLEMGKQRGVLDAEAMRRMTHRLSEVPARANEILGQRAEIEAMAPALAKVTDIIYMGRGTAFPIAMEGALKLKEISYIHAEGYAAGELKHGPIALIDENVPIVVIAPSDRWFEKTASNLQEVKARGGQVWLISDAQGLQSQRDHIAQGICVPKTDDFVAPILYALPIQLLAYYIAVEKGTDVDQPRNLAKSVTVE